MTYYSVPPYTWQPYDELIERLEGSQGPRGPTDGGEQRKFFPTGIQSSFISRESHLFAIPTPPRPRKRMNWMLSVLAQTPISSQLRILSGWYLYFQSL
ncbi:hypothetical protein DTO207G8_7010 [Paecilomyces variotii]|nr:hypothetical protein DTO169E5_5924 [Paecilomyces variotii]KAJ9248942.1 hypothetical protein DTO207G8_7010 [Paecilomyces variotii]